MEYAKIKDDDSMVRDMRTGALVSNTEELEAYRAKRVKLLIERDKEREFRVLQNDVKDLKSLLQELLTKLS